MNQSKGVEGPSPKPEMGEIKEALGGPEHGGVTHTSIRTTGALKRLLVQHYGEEKGTKLYNRFMVTFAMMMLSQVQHAAQRAQKAAQDMRSDTH